MWKCWAKRKKKCYIFIHNIIIRIRYRSTTKWVLATRRSIANTTLPSLTLCRLLIMCFYVFCTIRSVISSLWLGPPDDRRKKRNDFIKLQILQKVDQGRVLSSSNGPNSRLTYTHTQIQHLGYFCN